MTYRSVGFVRSIRVAVMSPQAAVLRGFGLSPKFWVPDSRKPKNLVVILDILDVNIGKDWRVAEKRLVSAC